MHGMFRIGLLSIAPVLTFALKGLEPLTTTFSLNARAVYPCTASCLLSGTADCGPTAEWLARKLARQSGHPLEQFLL